MSDQATGILIDLAEVSALQVPERCRDSLNRIKGFIAFVRPTGDEGAA